MIRRLKPDSINTPTPMFISRTLEEVGNNSGSIYAVAIPQESAIAKVKYSSLADVEHRQRPRFYVLDPFIVEQVDLK
jgi:hypothetical protein